MSTRFVRTRTPGRCVLDFAHADQIHPGEIVQIATHFPGSEEVRDFGVEPLSRSRTCERCVLDEQASMARRGYTTLTLRDRHGDRWTVNALGLLTSSEETSSPIEQVRRERGPLVVDRTEAS